MPKKVVDFLFSFGLMIIGVSLLFAFTVSVHIKPNTIGPSFPKSNPRVMAMGGDIYFAPEELPKPTNPLAKNNSEILIPLTSISAFVMDETTDIVLFAKNADEIRSLASITKIMSAIVLMDLPIIWTATTSITDSDHDGSSHILSIGEVYSADDLWSAGLVGSSNSAIRALVRISGLTEAEFVDRMNKKAKILGLASLVFTDPTGLGAGNVGSARDTALMLKEGLRYDKIASTLQIGELYIQAKNSTKQKRIWSTNRLLIRWTPHNFETKNIAGKTGYIINSRYNFTARIGDENNNKIIVVVFGSESADSRFTEARDLTEAVFAKFAWPGQDGYNELVD
jgi:D-alanyl-D-alanine endopeptidase (penicillin-binding protein 7)